MLDPFAHTLRVLEFDALRAVLAGHAATPAGRRAAAALMPTRQFASIVRLQRETTELVQLLVAGNCPPLSGVADIADGIAGLAQARVPLEPEDLLAIAETLQAMQALRTFGACYRELAPTLWEAIQPIGDFAKECAEIDRCIDRDKTVHAHASPKLNDLRRHITTLRGQIHERLRRVMESAEAQHALEDTVITERNGRPVLVIKSGMRNAVAGTVWDRSQSGATLFIEPHAVTAMVNQLDELRFEEAREVERILWILTRLLDARSADILAGCAVLTHVDLTFAKARYSIACRMCAAEPRDDTRMILRDARHPLLLHYATAAAGGIEAVVPISLRLGDEYDSIVITGPNTGGKTVALKTIGLLTLMAQCGMHLPVASGSCMPVTRAVYADIGDEQSLQQSLSTFSAHIRTLVAILAQASAGALVLLDELGAGTDPADGAALATALLEHLRQRGIQAVATTHLGALKVYASSVPRVENACVEFNAETMRPTFRLLIGQPGASNAIVIAHHFGMPAEILDGARAVLAEGALDTTELLNKVQAMRVEAEERRTRADDLQRDATARMADVEAERGRIVDEAHALVEDTMRDLCALLDEYQQATANAPAPWGDCARTLCERLRELARGTPLAEQQAQFVERVKLGDRVFVRPLQSFGIVRAIRRKKRMMHVEIGKVETEVPFSGIAERPFNMPQTSRAKPTAPDAAPPPALEPATEVCVEEPAVITAWDTLAVGDEVYVPLLHSAATVQRIDRAQQRLTVRAGAFDTVVPFSKVRCKLSRDTIS